jgi:ATP-dependent Clp protease ATP-binding subunit ClpX
MNQRNADCSFCRKSYREVAPLVEGPGEIYICGECVELCQSIIAQEKHRRRRFTEGGPPMPTREAIRGKFDQLVVGHDQAKDALSRSVLRRGEASGPQSPVLLIGPTRSSKIFLTRALAHAVAAPFAEGDSQALVRAVTEPAEPLLYRLLLASAFDVEVAQSGIVYVDGVDQRATQEALLQLWEGAAGQSSGHRLQIDMARLLFICGGQFAGLGETAAQLGRHAEQPVTREMLARFGMAPDLVKRIQAILWVGPLNEDTLVRMVPYVACNQMASSSAEQRNGL